MILCHQQTGYNLIRPLMQKGVLPLNAFLAFFYLALTALTALFLKLSLRSRQPRPAPQLSRFKSELNMHKILGLSLLKKLTMAGACFNSEKRYLPKEMLIVGAFGVCCLGVNGVIIWPAAVALGLLPVCMLIIDWVAPKIKNECENQRGDEVVDNAREQVIGEVNSHEVRVDCERIESAVALPSQSEASARTVKKTESASVVEMLLLGGLSLGSMVMLLDVMMSLGTSVSNSGQLNISSVLLCLVIDQLGIRIGIILLAFGMVEALNATGLIEMDNNLLVAILCEQEIDQEVIRLAKEEEEFKKNQPPEIGIEQQTASPFKVQQEHQLGSEELDLANLQPEESPISPQSVVSSPAEQLNVPSSPDEFQSNSSLAPGSPYLTTPQKELFQEDQSEGVSILGDACANAAQYDVGTDANKSTIGVAEPTKKSTLELLIDENHPHAHSQFTLEQSMEGNSRGARKANNRRRKAKRVIKMTGPSPYLQYLPNMLKNVQNYKNGHSNQVPPRKML